MRYAVILAFSLAGLFTHADPDLKEDLSGACEFMMSRRDQGPYSDADVSENFRGIETFWKRAFELRGWEFRALNFRLYSGETPSPCGNMQSHRGPIFCPVNDTLYLDLAYFESARPHLGPRTPALLKFVLSHEFGHHLQLLRGIFRVPAARFDSLRPSFEAQADCLAGVFLRGERQQGKLTSDETLDILGRLMIIGDDVQSGLAGDAGLRLKPSGHGYSMDRLRWFSKGFRSGDLNECERHDLSVFSGPNP